MIQRVESLPHNKCKRALPQTSVVVCVSLMWMRVVFASRLRVIVRVLNAWFVYVCECFLYISISFDV